jgi:hypothetical protein
MKNLRTSCMPAALTQSERRRSQTGPVMGTPTPSSGSKKGPTKLETYSGPSGLEVACVFFFFFFFFWGVV